MARTRARCCLDYSAPGSPITAQNGAMTAICCQDHGIGPNGSHQRSTAKLMYREAHSAKHLRAPRKMMHVANASRIQPTCKPSKQMSQSTRKPDSDARVLKTGGTGGPSVRLCPVANRESPAADASTRGRKLWHRCERKTLCGVNNEFPFSLVVHTSV